ncbi:hypothetical protein GW17_00034154 [Ensete ventricosum]|nr:hypothetical protein GW17_00034154 [Ensete ventricosum]
MASIYGMKGGICRYKERRWDAKLLIGSGGMPSSHSATVTALAAAIGIQDGLRSSIFAAATIFASVVSSTCFHFIVMHDAFGVRLHAGKQAEVIAGAVLGFIVATMGQLIKMVVCGT